MELLQHHLCIGIATRPLLSPSRSTRKLLKLNAISGGSSSFSLTSKWANRLLADFQFLPSTITNPDNSDQNHANSSPMAALIPPPPPLTSTERHVSMPIDFYGILGAEAHFLGDGIRRAYEAKVSRPPQYGYTQDALVSRRQILQAACDTLVNSSSRREYDQSLADDEFDTIHTQVPWEKVPGALSLLQEAGETEVVLQIGEILLKERLPKYFKQDVVLAMSLAYVDLSRDAMALSPPDFIKGSELLERALKLLQEEGARSLAPDLQAQIDETLEEINPRCVLELLALPLGDDYHSKRAEGLQGVRNILWAVGGGGATAIAGGFTREDFMNEAFLNMTAAEHVDLFVATPSNIPAESFEVYGVALALVAQAFVSKKPNLIRDADNLFQQLQQTKVTGLENSMTAYTIRETRDKDFALERGLCSLLVGEVDDCRSWLGLDSENSPYRDPSIFNFVLEHSKDDHENDNLPGLCRLLETWLMEVVFPRFRESEDITFRLGDYYDDPTVLRYLEMLEGVGSSPLAAAAAIAKIGAEATAVLDGVKSSALQTLQKVFPLGHSEGSMKIDDEYDRGNLGNYELAGRSQDSLNSDVHDSSVNAQGDPTHVEVHKLSIITEKVKDLSVKIMCGGVAVGLLTLLGLKFFPVRRNGSTIPSKDVGSTMASDVINVGSLVDEKCAEISEMDVKLAENLVRKWQNIKALALGPEHCLGKLSEVLDGQMLKIWSDRAAKIAHLGLFWDYSLQNLTVDSLTVSVDRRHAIVETTVEELAQVTDPAHPELADSESSTYTIRYEMSYGQSGWKITGGSVVKE